MEEVKNIRFEIPSEKKLFFKEYLTAINGVLNLSNKEIDVFAALIQQYNNLKKKTANDEIINELLFSPRYKALTRESINLNDLNFNNYLSALKKKGMIIEDATGFKKLNDIAVPVIDLETTSQVNLVFSFSLTQPNSNEQQQNNASEEISDKWDIEDNVSEQLSPEIDSGKEQFESDAFEVFEEQVTKLPDNGNSESEFL